MVFMAAGRVPAEAHAPESDIVPFPSHGRLELNLDQLLSSDGLLSAFVALRGWFIADQCGCDRPGHARPGCVCCL